MQKTIYSEKHQQLCSMLLRARIRKDLTQVEVAKKLGVPQSWVAKVEIGERRLDVIEFSQLAKVLGIDVAQFFRSLKKMHKSRPAV